MRRLRPDVVVLDLKMRRNGETLLAEIDDADVRTPVLCLTEHGDGATIASALAAGAAGS